VVYVLIGSCNPRFILADFEVNDVGGKSPVMTRFLAVVVFVLFVDTSLTPVAVFATILYLSLWVKLCQISAHLRIVSSRLFVIDIYLFGLSERLILCSKKSSRVVFDPCVIILGFLVFDEFIGEGHRCVNADNSLGLQDPPHLFKKLVPSETIIPLGRCDAEWWVGVDEINRVLVKCFDDIVNIALNVLLSHSLYVVIYTKL